jgi:glycerate dehydrogenase
MTEGLKIIATDMDIPQHLRDRVSTRTNGRYELVNIQTVQQSRKNDVVAVVLFASGFINEHLFVDFPNIELIQSMSAGVDFIDFGSIPENVVLCSNAGAYKESIAEHAFAMILFFAKNLARNHEKLREGIFENPGDGIYLGGKTLGVVGAGGIGQSVARVAKAFNMKTVGINTSGRTVQYFDSVWRMDRLDELLKESDFVVISIPLNIHTNKLIDRRKLSLMKEDSILINVARGSIIVQDDLYAHLKANPRFKAGIDVWWQYPKKGERFRLDFPFFELTNFIASPHSADGVPEALPFGLEYALENVLRVADGSKPERVVDKKDYEGLKTRAHPLAASSTAVVSKKD